MFLLYELLEQHSGSVGLLLFLETKVHIYTDPIIFFPPFTFHFLVLIQDTFYQNECGYYHYVQKWCLFLIFRINCISDV